VPLDPKTKPPAVFLTGATGFLGAFLLRELLAQTDASVYCLVRPKAGEDAATRVRRTLVDYGLWDECIRPRIVGVVGDLTEPLLGLSAVEFDALAGKLDAIYHSGAVVNFVESYDFHKRANVFGTQEVLRLASRGAPKPLHHISSLAVFWGADYQGRLIPEEEVAPSGRALLLGYSQSKWAAEKLVLAARSLGLPATLYRPADIWGHSQSGVSQRASFTWSLILTCLQIGAAPETGIVVDAVPVDYVARAIVALSLRTDALGRTFHLVNPAPVPITQIQDYGPGLDYALRRLPFEQWRQEAARLVSELPGDPLYAFLSLLEKMLSEDVLPPRLDPGQVGQLLGGSGILCPPLDRPLISKYLSYFVSSGLLQPQPALENSAPT
jgi:thioester reductase-like protein